MKLPICIIIFVVLILIWYVRRESFSATNYRAIGNSIRDLVDNNLNIFQYRSQYGGVVSPLKLNYLITAYKNGSMTDKKIAEIMAM